MTTQVYPDRTVTDPVRFICDLIAEAEHALDAECVRAAVEAVAGGRAKSRRLAAALAERPAVLRDGASPAPRAIGDLLIALRTAGATGVAAP